VSSLPFSWGVPEVRKGTAGKTGFGSRGKRSHLYRRVGESQLREKKEPLMQVVEGQTLYFKEWRLRQISGQRNRARFLQGKKKKFQGGVSAMMRGGAFWGQRSENCQHLNNWAIEAKSWAIDKGKKKGSPIVRRSSLQKGRRILPKRQRGGQYVHGGKNVRHDMTGRRREDLPFGGDGCQG